MGKWNGFKVDTSKHKDFTPYYDKPLPYDLTAKGKAALEEDEDEDDQ